MLHGVDNATGNLATVTDSSGATSTYGYDAAGNVTTITDAKGAVTQFIYDNSKGPSRVSP